MTPPPKKTDKRGDSLQGASRFNWKSGSSRCSGLLNDNVEGTLSRRRLLRLLQAQELLQPGDTPLVGTEFPPP